MNWHSIRKQGASQDQKTILYLKQSFHLLSLLCFYHHWHVHFQSTAHPGMLDEDYQYHNLDALTCPCYSTSQIQSQASFPVMCKCVAQSFLGGEIIFSKILQFEHCFLAKLQRQVYSQGFSHMGIQPSFENTCIIWIAVLSSCLLLLSLFCFFFCKLVLKTAGKNLTGLNLTQSPLRGYHIPGPKESFGHLHVLFKSWLNSWQDEIEQFFLICP